MNAEHIENLEHLARMMEASRHIHYEIHTDTAEDIRAVLAQLTTTRLALEPFARKAAVWADGSEIAKRYCDDEEVRITVRIGNLRAAKAALEAK